MEKYVLGIVGFVIAVALIGLLANNSTNTTVTGYGTYYSGNLVKTQQGMKLVSGKIQMDGSKGTDATQITDNSRTMVVPNGLPVRVENGGEYVIIKGTRISKYTLEKEGIVIQNGKIRILGNRKQVSIIVH